MAKYHKYVFDEEKRKLVGSFEEMYLAEETEGFDSWQSNDVRNFRLRVVMQILNEYNFQDILELGCGKGVASQFLKKKNNNVLGIDISETAIKKAKINFPDIEFRELQADCINQLEKSFDLVTVMTVFAYIENWRDILKQIRNMTQYCLVAEYIPDNPIGMVKSIDDLTDIFSQEFEIIRKVLIDDNSCILFGKKNS